MVRESSFGDVLRGYREAAGRTQEDLAEAAGLSARGLRHLERGERRPYPETIRRLATALGLAPADQAAFAAAARAAQPESPPHLHNLPLQLTSFVGREHALAQLRWQLAERPDRRRLLTLTGAGGCGKTRLALQVAAGLLERYAQGVWLVELAPLADPALVPLAVATALGLGEEAGRPLTETLSAALRARHLLLLLDNCEHLLGASATLTATLLRACPELQVLATSREALGLVGEAVWRVPSLLAPDSEHPPAPEALTRYEAVQLFVERARAVRPDFALGEKNAAAVAQICRRLDGIPLAIELAAALVRGLAAEQIARRLDDRFGLLTGGDRAALPRQQTLRATVDWSYALLSPHEQALFNRLGVFAGSFTIEAAEAVCAGGPILAREVAGALVRLVDTSLVVAEHTAGEIERYRLLETLRQYGNERLAAAGEADDLAAKHAAYYGSLADEAHLGMQRHPHTPWLERLEAEHPNLRQALRWALDAGAIREGLRLAGGLMWYWYFGGYTGEGQQWLGDLLARPEKEDPSSRSAAARCGKEDPSSRSAAAHCGAAARTAWRSRALTSLAFLRAATRWLNGARWSDAETTALIDEAVAIAREMGPREVLGFALWVRGISRSDVAALEESLALYRDELHIPRGVHGNSRDLGHLAWERGDKVRAQAWWLESLRLSRQSGDLWDLANDLDDLGMVAYDEGDYARARSRIEEALALRRSMRDRPGLSIALGELGAVARALGDTALARASYEEKLALWQRVGNRAGTAEALTDLGGIARQAGDWAQAEARCREALALRRALGHRPDIASSLAHLGAIAHERGDYEQAAVHCVEGLGLVQGPGERGAAALCLMGMARVCAARGQLAEAVCLYAAADPGPATRATRWPPSGWDERTAHDRQVAALRSGLGEEAFAAAWAAGQALGLERSIGEALADRSHRFSTATAEQVSR